MQQASPIFFPSRSISGTLSSIVRQKALQLGVLVLQGLQPLGLADVHAAKPGPPFVNARIADAMLPAQIGNDLKRPA